MLPKLFSDNIESALGDSYFSLNIDEATSSNCMRVLAVLVSYFNSTREQMEVHHLAAISLTKVDAASITAALVDLFASKNLKWENCMSILMDSCAVMRGSKNGVETSVRRTLAPHLLDID